MFLEGSDSRNVYTGGAATVACPQLSHGGAVEQGREQLINVIEFGIFLPSHPPLPCFARGQRQGLTSGALATDTSSGFPLPTILLGTYMVVEEEKTR